MEPESEERRLLKEERRQRKKDKRKSKQADKKRLKDEQKLLLEIKSQGDNISIVTHHFDIRFRHNENEPKPEQSLLQLTNSEFPLLTEKISKTTENKKHIVPVNNNLNTSIPNRNFKKFSKSINIPLEDFIRKREENIQKNVPNEAKKSNLTCSNPLDSSKPLKISGKHKDVPKEKKIRLFKKQLLEDIQTETVNLETDFFNYCDNVDSEDLKQTIMNLLQRIVDLQEKMYSKCPEKAVRKRRYVNGLHEVKKNLLVKKIKLLIFATNMQVIENGVLHNKIEDLKNIAKEKEIPYIYTLTRKTLGKLCLKTTPVSCVGILNYEGADEFYHDAIQKINIIKAENEHKETTFNCDNLLEKFKNAILDDN